MKKSIIIFLISLLILNIFVISLIKAEDNGDSALPQELQGIQEAGEKLTNEEQRSQYLKQEWGKILANNTIMSPIIKGYEKISPITDPIFKYAIGLEPALNWLFVLTFTLWVAFLIYTFRIFELASPFSKSVQYATSIGIIIIISIMGATKALAEYIIDIISLFTTWWMQLIGIGLVIIGLVIASIFSKNLKDVFKAMKEKKAKDEEEINRKKLKTDVEVADAFTKGITRK